MDRTTVSTIRRAAAVATAALAAGALLLGATGGPQAAPVIKKGPGAHTVLAGASKAPVIK